VDPEPADGEALEAQHVEHSGVGQGGGEELGALGEGRPHQEAAVAAALDGEAAGARVRL